MTGLRRRRALETVDIRGQGFTVYDGFDPVDDKALIGERRVWIDGVLVTRESFTGAD